MFRPPLSLARSAHALRPLPIVPSTPNRNKKNPQKTAEYQFNFPDPGNLAPPVIAASAVSFRYGGKVKGGKGAGAGGPAGPNIFRDLDLSVDLDTRVAVVGPNGIGKSTLLGLISGALEPTEGFVSRNPGVRVAVFSQHHVDGLDLALTPVEVMCRAYAPLLKEQEARAHLGAFGVGGTLALQALYTLSGGQKSRVALARLTYSKPHVLLLDEVGLVVWFAWDGCMSFGFLASSGGGGKVGESGERALLPCGGQGAFASTLVAFSRSRSLFFARTFPAAAAAAHPYAESQQRGEHLIHHPHGQNLTKTQPRRPTTLNDENDDPPKNKKQNQTNKKQPTNHLDMESIDALVAGLAGFPGGVVVVSHDAHFLSAAVDAYWCVEGGEERTVKPFDGTFAEYRARVQRMRAKEAVAAMAR